MKLNMETYEMMTKKSKVHGKFINREISWISFNKRVLSCAFKSSNPMNERLNFLGITESNLDEFISVRFSNAFYNQDTEPYKEILHKIKKFKDSQNEVYKVLQKEIEKKFHLSFTTPDKLSKKEKERLYSVFTNNIFPLLTPMDMSQNEINIISGLSYISVLLNRRNGRESLTVIPLLKNIDSIYQINNKVLFLEDIVLYYMNNDIFINQNIIDKAVFRIIRDGSVILSHDESRFIIDRMQETIDLRNHAKPLFLYLRKNCSDRMENVLESTFKIPDEHVYTNNIISNYKIFSNDKLLGSDQSYKPFNPFNYENYGNYYNIFDAISSEDILLHHPYDSYDTVIKFIEHAAIDQDVETIKQTLYRVSSIDSPIVNALCKASDNGKFVTVLVEIKARFDEENNISVIKKLKRHNVNVILGSEFLKTHCKICSVTRRENDKIKIYTHLATGNYNEKTSKIYTDLSYFTSKQKIGIDILNIFNILSGHSKPDEKLQKVYYSPVNLRSQLVKCINREIHNAKKGNKGEIFIKVNSISDPDMVNKLYEAADSGVHVDIVCRGICSIVPRKNLRIKSIVGRFLEHSRIYYFYNDKNPEYYISSADLLTRNLDRRVETLVSLKDSNVVKQIEWIIKVFKKDSLNSFIMTKDGKWEHAKGDFDSHEWFIEYSNIKKQKKGWK